RGREAKKTYPRHLSRLLRLGGERRSEQTGGTGEERAPIHLLDDLVRLREHRGRDRQPEGLGGLEVDSEFQVASADCHKGSVLLAEGGSRRPTSGARPAHG